MGSVFLSYRREDTEGQAGRLYDDLIAVFGSDSVFMDVAAIQPGRDFRKSIDQSLNSCGVFLSLIGRNWLTVKNPSGQSRLDDPNDFVRIETGAVLKRDIPVIPVLVQGASAPRADQLPDDLKELAFRNAVELTHARWNSDLEVLIKALRPHISPPSPQPRPKQDQPGSRIRLTKSLTAIVVLLVIAIGIAFYLRRETSEQFTFVPSNALTPELHTQLNTTLQRFDVYAESIGLRVDDKPQIAILNENEATIPGMMSYYNPDAQGGAEAVVLSRYASDADLVLREYCHHLLAANRPGGPRNYEGDSATYAPHFAIESALASYLPASFNNNPRFAERSGATDNFARAHNLSELKGDIQSAYVKDAEIWGNLFWELRQKFGRQKIDGQLVRAWFSLSENAPLDAQKKAFGRAIVAEVRRTLGNNSAMETRILLAGKGLVL